MIRSLGAFFARSALFRTCSHAALVLSALSTSAHAATLLNYNFNETGSSAASSGTNTTALTMRNDAGTATDLHSADALGVTGKPGDRSYANLGPNDHGSVASAATNGFRANQADISAIDQLSSFTLSGWFKTETTGAITGKTPRLFWNHDGEAGSSGDGFNLQFFSDSHDLKLDIDDDSSFVNTTGNQFADKQTWTFFAVTYDGTIATNNVKFYKGYRNLSEALTGTTHTTPEVKLISTHTLNRGAVDSESTGLVLGNRTGGDRPFDGYLDNTRIDGVTSGNGGVLTLAQLEEIRHAVAILVPEPSSMLLSLMAAIALVFCSRRRR